MLIQIVQELTNRVVIINDHFVDVNKSYNSKLGGLYGRFGNIILYEGELIKNSVTEKFSATASDSIN